MNLPKFNLNKYFPPKQSNNVIVKSQLYSASDSPFQTYLNGYEPLRYNLKIYNILREAIPILDVAVLKLRRLIGDFEYRCDNPNVLKALNNFKKEIRVGYFHKGLHGCLQQVYDSALANGYGVFETIPFTGLNGVDRLKVGDASKVRFIRKDGRLWLASIPHEAAKPVILEHPEFVQYLTFDLRDGHPQGVSLFNSMPFVAEILLRIQQSIKNAIVRIGDPTFVLLIEGGRGTNYTDLKDSADKLLTQLEDVNKDRKRGQVRDIGGAVPSESKVSVKVLGEGAQLMDMEIPSRIIIEQIIARTELPPFSFGLYNWNSNFKMSEDQKDLLISSIEERRDSADSVIEKVTNTFLMFEGYTGAKWYHEWNPVGLFDETEMARARHLNASALEKELKALEWLLDHELMEEQEAVEYVAGLGFVSKVNKDASIKRVAQNFVNRKKRHLAKQSIDFLLGDKVSVSYSGHDKRGA